MKTLATPRAFRRAFFAGDASFDGLFVAAVRSTGVYCRPSCRARKPRPENVEFFDRPELAEQRGFRACKRCRPREWVGANPSWMAAIERVWQREPGRVIANRELPAFGVEPATARRWCLSQHGATFQQLQRARRVSRAAQALRAGRSAAEAGEAGAYQSESGFRAAFTRLFARAPRAHATRESITIQRLSSPLGTLIAGATSAHVCLLEFVDRRDLPRQIETLRRLLDAPAVLGSSPLLVELERQLGQYFERRRTRFDLPLCFPGTPFETRVWSALREIETGRTISYERLAARIGRPGAARAVGGAVGRNRLAILIPCHRVLRADESAGGYAGGVWRKRRLLELEGIVLDAQA